MINLESSQAIEDLDKKRRQKHFAAMGKESKTV